MKKLFALLLVVGSAGLASANGGCPGGPFCQTNAGFNGAGRLPLFGGTPVPAFQAAPWYLYWPYHSHFQMAAPMGGGFTPPPGTGFGGGMANPYFANPYFGGASGLPAAMPAYTAPAPAATAMPAVIPSGR